MKYLLSTFSLVALLQTMPMIQPAQALEARTGVNDGNVQQVVKAQLMSNFPDGEFYPERLISRAELAEILVKTFQLEKRSDTKKANVFVADVPSSHRAYKDIQIVLKTDIMRGYRDNMFFPNQRITRAEALAIFAQAYGVFQFPEDTVSEILTPYPDAAAIPIWARKAIATVISEGLINTDAQGNLNPLSPMTRGDMAYVLSKYLQRQQPLAETPEAPEAPQR